MAAVAEIVSGALARQATTIRGFITEPVGVFETSDRLVKNARATARELFGAVGVEIPTKMLRR